MSDSEEEVNSAPPDSRCHNDIAKAKQRHTDRLLKLRKQQQKWRHMKAGNSSLASGLKQAAVFPSDSFVSGNMLQAAFATRATTPRSLPDISNQFATKEVSKPTELDITEAIATLASRISSQGENRYACWEQKPSRHSGAVVTRKVLTSSTLEKEVKSRLQQGSSGEDVSGDHRRLTPVFCTSLPPLVTEHRRRNLRDAAYSRDLGALKLLLREKRDEGTLTSSDLNNTLMVAISRKVPALVQALLEAGADSNSFKELNPPLVQAALTNCEATVDVLLQFRADPNLPESCRNTPLYIASQRGNLNIIRMLIEKGATATASSMDGMTSLMVAAKEGHVACVEYLLSETSSKSHVNLRDDTGRTAMYYAALSGKRCIITALKKQGAKVVVGDNKWMTPLSVALTYHKDIEDLFTPETIDAIDGTEGTDCQADGPQQTDQPQTSGRDMDITHDPDDKLSWKKYEARFTLLAYGAASGHVATVDYCLQRGADATLELDVKGRTALHYAIHNGHNDVIRLLIQKVPMSLQTFGPHGNMTSLDFHLSKLSQISDNDRLTLSLFVDNGADVNAALKSTGNSSALDFAMKGEFSKMEWLMEQGADPGTSADKASVLWHACCHHDPHAIIRLLLSNFDLRTTDIGYGTPQKTPLQLALGNVDFTTSTLTYRSHIPYLISAGCSLRNIANIIPGSFNTEGETSSSAHAQNESEVDPYTLDTENGGEIAEVWKAIRIRSMNPRPLQEVCKLSIKKSLGYSRIPLNTRIDELPLPSSLKEYLRASFIDGVFDKYRRELKSIHDIIYTS